jgi:RimJ/RimL family protein N-acetyltransferase
MGASVRPPVIETPRVRLVVLLPDEIRALIAGDTVGAGRAAAVRFPRGWPDDPEASDGLPWHLRHLEASESELPWRIRVVVESAPKEVARVIGSINLKGPPDREGDVEIGWGIDRDRRRRGLAFEAASAVMTWAAEQPGVRSLSATIPADNFASQRLAAKLGFAITTEARRGLPLWVRRYE